MRSVSLRQLVGLLALLVFAVALPLQAIMGAPMTECAPAHAEMSHEGMAQPCGGDTGVPLKAATDALCATLCAPVAALPAQVAAPVDHGRVAHSDAAMPNLSGRVTAPDPFPPRPTVRA
ncbi:hypothetical protein [Inquilinus limosus]|uniref:hypothetical protein n=1 Tax=Inquilinus limosus TaxID=171674 RepID=UPI00047BD52F|nr:hypothetical protein [Inquilinus limosus]